jgi:c-di-GMP-binding flagellar brake protein YcgR
MEETGIFTDKPFAERRRFPRLNLNASVQFRHVLKPQKAFTGAVCKNLSAQGMCMAGAPLLSPEARLVLLLSLPKLLKPLRMIAKVTWMREQPQSERFDYGLQFIEISSQDQDTIAGYVERGVVAP